MIRAILAATAAVVFVTGTGFYTLHRDAVWAALPQWHKDCITRSRGEETLENLCVSLHRSEEALAKFQATTAQLRILTGGN